MYIKVQSDKTLLVTVPTTIYRGENKTDTMVFLVPMQYEDMEIASCSMILRYIAPSGVGHSEMLKLLPELYNGYLQYRLSVETDITADDGILVLWLSCISEQDYAVFKTGELNITIQPSKNIDEFLPPDDLDQLDRLSFAVSNLEKSKADNIYYDSSDKSLQLMSNGSAVGDEVQIGSSQEFNIIDGGGAI